MNKYIFSILSIILVVFLCSTQNLYCGDEFQVNIYTSDDQYNPDIAMDSNGNFVITWTSWEQDGSNCGVFARRYNKDAIPISGEFQVNTYYSSTQKYPSIAMNDVGNFIITWQSHGQDSSGYGVFAQRFDNSGNKIGGEFQVNTYTNLDQENPVIAMDDNGDFVITWESRYSQDGSGSGIYTQLYDNDGNQIGDEFQVNTYTDLDQKNPAVAMDDEGKFIITWESYSQDGSGYGIYAQRYESNGNPVGCEFQVNSYTSDDQLNPNITMNGDGNFIIAWESWFQDGSNSGIYFQRYDSDGNPVDNEQQANTYTSYSQGNPSIDMNNNGNFVIAWESDSQDGSGYGVYAQRFDNSGNPVGEEFQANSYITDHQYNCSVAIDDNGKFVVTWESYYQDGSWASVHARQFSFYTPTPTGSTTPEGTPTPTPADFKPILMQGKVEPESGYQSTEFEYSVYYQDQDGGTPPITRVYINDVDMKMQNTSGEKWDGWYSFKITGSELNVGSNEFYFLFVDDEGDFARLPESGFFQKPYVELSVTPTPTFTELPTNTPSLTQTPTLLITRTETSSPTITITPTQIPEECLRISSPKEFYYNTILLSWTPVERVDHYQIYFKILGNEYLFDIEDNWLRLILQEKSQWEYFINLGTILYDVTAIDSEGQVIAGPSKTSYFELVPFNNLDKKTAESEKEFQANETGCLKITNPPDFYYNTLLLSWTPIYEALYYELEIRYMGEIFSFVEIDNYLYMTFPNPVSWNSFVSIGSLEYRVSAYDDKRNLIDGPTDWSSFRCY